MILGEGSACSEQVQQNTPFSGISAQLRVLLNLDLHIEKQVVVVQRITFTQFQLVHQLWFFLYKADLAHYALAHNNTWHGTPLQEQAQTAAGQNYCTQIADGGLPIGRCHSNLIWREIASNPR